MPGDGKTDMERIGLFSELGYISIGDKYVTSGSKSFNESASKNRQIIPGGSKSMANATGGYFDGEFKRIFERESYSDPLKERRKYRIDQAKRNMGKSFLPSSGEIKPSGKGSFYGTLSGPIPAFSAELKKRKAYTAPGKNFYTNPSKHGTGYGYPNVSLGKDYQYAADDFDISQALLKKEHESHKQKLKGGPFRLNAHPKDYFDENPYLSDKPLPPLKEKPTKKGPVKPFVPSSPSKQAGGMKAGTFNQYPNHSNDPYSSKSAKSKISAKGGKPFHPPAGPKSYPVQSILASNVIKSVTPANYRTVTLMSY
uniref:Cilia-and flagella-associated protein 96 n=1 Tax=Leptobrachium leishanense TaxID=445787 RepID=A0A8C5P6S6_9ANUR